MRAAKSGIGAARSVIGDAAADVGARMFVGWTSSVLPVYAANMLAFKLAMRLFVILEEYPLQMGVDHFAAFSLGALLPTVNTP